MGMSMSALASASALESLRAAGASLFAQHARLLRLRFAANARIDGEMLLPHRIHGEEGLSANYRYVLDCLSPDAGLELKALLGQPVEVGLLLPDGGERLYSGLVTRVEQRGADGGFGLFTLTIEPALALLAHRRNSRVFQDKTVPEIVKAILQEHQSGNPAFSHSFLLRDDTVLKYPQRSYCLQYREADLAFIERLLAEEGIAWRYAHGGGEGGSRNGPSGSATSLVRSDAAEADGVPTHTLVLFDDSAVLPVLTGEHELGRTGRTRPAGIRFHRTAGVERDDGMDVWLGERQIDSGRTTLLAYDYKAVDAHLGSAEASILQGDAGDSCCAGLEDYDPQTLYYGQDPREMSRYAALRQQARDRQGKVFNGEGSARCLAAGGWFPLADHPLHDQDSEEDRQFLVTRLSFAARNNLLPETEDPFRCRQVACWKERTVTARDKAQRPTGPGWKPSADTSASCRITTVAPIANPRLPEGPLQPWSVPMAKKFILTSTAASSSSSTGSVGRIIPMGAPTWTSARLPGCGWPIRVPAQPGELNTYPGLVRKFWSAFLKTTSIVRW